MRELVLLMCEGLDAIAVKLRQEGIEEESDGYKIANETDDLPNRNKIQVINKMKRYGTLTGQARAYERVCEALRGLIRELDRRDDEEEE